MNNRNKKIIFSIIIVLIAIFGIVGVNALNKNLTSKVNTKDEVVLSDDKDSNISDNSNEQENEQKTKIKDEKQDSKAQDKKEENKSKEDKDKTVNEKANSKYKQDNNNKTSEQNKSEIKNEEAKSNANINKSKTTDNNTNINNKEIAKNQQINKKANTLENQSKKQTIELSIINEVNNRTLFCGQLPINGDENFNNIMNKFLSNNGVKHINRGGYISMMYGLSEFNAGPSSGWCYYVNGNKSSIGIEGYIPKNGDKVVWKYLKDGVNN